MDINNLEIKRIALHQIDVRNELPEYIVIDKEKESVRDYIENLIKEIIQSPNKRTYRFKSGNTQVKSSIKSIVDEEGALDEIIFENAKRLLEKEKIRSADMARKNLGIELQRGSLLHVHFISDDSERVLICKVESDEFLDDTNFELNRGLNTKKKVFKSFLLIVGTQTIFVNDKNNSKYWWDEFLELDFEIGDDKNTTNSLSKIIGIVDNIRLKQEFALDGTLLRNDLLGYYRKNEVFNFGDMFNEVFDSYEPYSPDFPKEKIKERIMKLVDDSKFDNQFQIIQSEVNKKIISRIKIANGIFISIEDFKDNLEKVLQPYDNLDGSRGMTIISDEAYNFIRQKLYGRNS